MTGQPDYIPNKRLRLWIWLFLAVSIVGALATAWVGIYKRHNPDPLYVQAERLVKDPMNLTRHVRIDGVDLWIPVAYFESRIPLEVDQKDVLLITLYPEFEPLKQRKQELWEQGEWYRNVRWLIQDASSMKTLPDNYASVTSAWKATEFKSMEYGLRYYSQPDDQQNDFDEIWLEGTPDYPQSYVECGKKITESDHPECSHSVWSSHHRYRISFDKKLLPHWREIKDKTLALTKQFENDPRRNQPEAKGSHL